MELLILGLVAVLGLATWLVFRLVAALEARR
jgi:hypothetical protein